MARGKKQEFRCNHALLITGLVLCSLGMASEDPPWLVEPPGPLDERIDPKRITESEPPPMPAALVSPMPPVFRIAMNAEDAPVDADTWTRTVASIDRGLDFLRSRQSPSGTWMGGITTAPTDEEDVPTPIMLATTAMAMQGFAQRGHVPQADQTLHRALVAVLARRSEDGSYDSGSLSNYVTSSVISGLASLDDDRFRQAVREGVASLAKHQWDGDEGISTRADWFGGAGYGNRGRPDLSNTQTMLQALHDSGMSPDEPAFQEAVVFLTRTQNLTSMNPAPWAGDDGGFIYTPANGGESMGSEAAGEGRYGELMPAGQARSLRSYGSMTYAGFKSLIHAGLTAEDPRVRAAFDWIRHNWTFEENPGLGQQGLFYYWLAMSRALRVSQQTVITDNEGVSHEWRRELADAIIARQQPDGSWRNPEDRWLEGHEELATVYAVLALEELLKPDPVAKAIEEEQDE